MNLYNEFSGVFLVELKDIIMETINQTLMILQQLALLLAGIGAIFPAYQWWLESKDRELEQTVKKIETFTQAGQVSVLFENTCNTKVNEIWHKYSSEYGLEHNGIFDFFKFLQYDYMDGALNYWDFYTRCAIGLAKADKSLSFIMEKLNEDDGRTIFNAYIEHRKLGNRKTFVQNQPVTA